MLRLHAPTYKCRDSCPKVDSPSLPLPVKCVTTLERDHPTVGLQLPIVQATEVPTTEDTVTQKDRVSGEDQ